MPGINSAQEAARIAYYQSRRKVGRYLNRDLSFYSGAATVPQSFTGNLLLVAGGTGPGAKILNGINPFVPTPIPCEELVITSLVTAIGGDLSVTVLYNVLPGDIYILFNTSTGQVLPPLSVTPIVGGVVVVFNDDSPPADPGAWSFKIMRLANPTGCFYVKSNCLVIAPVVCLISLATLTGDGVSPNLPLFPGNSGTVTLTGTGFLSGPLNITITAAFGGPTPFTVDVVNILDDNNMTIDFTSVVGEDGQWGITVELAADPTCFDQIGFVLDEGIIAQDA